MIYVMGESRTGIVKIGYSVEPMKRLKEVQAGNHRQLQVLMTLPGDRRAERKLHERLADLCVGGEWFDFGTEDALSLVLDAASMPEPTDRPPAARPAPRKVKNLPWDVVELMVGAS